MALARAPSRQGWARSEGASGAPCRPGGSRRKAVAAGGPRLAVPPPALRPGRVVHWWVLVCAGMFCVCKCTYVSLRVGLM